MEDSSDEIKQNTCIIHDCMLQHAHVQSCLVAHRIDTIESEQKIDLIKLEMGRETDKQSTTIEDLVSSWRVHKGKVTKALPGSHVYT